jgi:hypothetical protein
MKHTLLALTLLGITACSQAEAGHSRGNGTCEDDKLHYENMTVNGKRSDAPLYAESQAMRDKAHTYQNIALCEKYMEEALRMIRKTGGEYPTE